MLPVAYRSTTYSSFKKFGAAQSKLKEVFTGSDLPEVRGSSRLRRYVRGRSVSSASSARTAPVAVGTRTSHLTLFKGPFTLVLKRQLELSGV